MLEKNIKIPSSDNIVELSVFIKESKEIKGIVQIAHGMAEHKERYLPFIDFLCRHSYACVIHDHRGHGESVKSNHDYGYFYSEDANRIVEDLHKITSMIKEEYPHVPIFIFAHSMGTLVARNYLKKYDYEIQAMILCGSPFHNKGAYFALPYVKLLARIKGDKFRSKLIQKISFGYYNRKFDPSLPNSWICLNPNTVHDYNTNDKCGYTFTTNGFLNLFKLIINAFKKNQYLLKNRQLPILFIAGEKDPVIGTKKQYQKTIAFMKKVGYENSKAILYPKLRHEILNEKNNEVIFQDVLDFYNENQKS